MERLRILRFDSIDSIKSYLGHFKKNEVAVGSNDKLLRFLDICRIEYETAEVHVPNDEMCHQIIIEQLNKTKTNIVAICFSKNKDIFILSLYYAVKKKCNLIFATEENINSIIKEVSKEYERCCVITDEQTASFIQTTVSVLDDFSLGIIAGRDSWETLYIINKSIAGSKKQINNSVSIDRTDHTEKGINRVGEYSYIPFSDSSANIILEAVSGLADIFSFMGHGRDELLWLKNSLLCSGMIQSKKTGNLPNCITTGKCFAEGAEVLPIHQIPSLTVFVNACLTGKIGDAYYGNEHNVAQVFLGENTVTYMGTPFLGKPFEAIVHYYVSLVMSGMKLGDVCKLINSFYNKYQIGVGNEFFLFGDPDYCLNSTSGIFEYNISDSEDNVVFELHKKAPLIILCYEGNLFDDFYALKKEVTLVNDSNQPIYCNMIKEEGAKKTFLHVFTRGLLWEGIYKLKITRSKLSQQWDINNIVRIEELVRMGLTNSKINLYINESINAVDNFIQCRNYNMARLDTISKNVYNKYYKLIKRMDTIHKSIVQEIKGKVHISGIYIEDYYMENGFKEIYRSLSKHKCCYCGSYLYDIDVINSLYGIHRKHYFCLRCGNVSSSPENAALGVYFQCEERQQKKETNLISLCIENRGQTTSSGVASIAIKSGEKIYNAIYSPEQVTFEIGPTEKQVIVFEISKEKVFPNRYSMLVGIVIADNHLYTTTRGIYFSDDPDIL